LHQTPLADLPGRCKKEYHAAAKKENKDLTLMIFFKRKTLILIRLVF
jgi:hypothetical protein